MKRKLILILGSISPVMSEAKDVSKYFGHQLAFFEVKRSQKYEKLSKNVPKKLRGLNLQQSYFLNQKVSKVSLLTLQGL